MPVKDKKKKKQRVKQKQTQKQTVSQKVVVNIGDKAITKKRKTTARQKQTSKPSNEYAFLVNQQNSFQTAMANQLNMLEQSRERFTQMRDAAIGEEREAIRGELLNINRQMGRAFDELNDQGIDVTAMLGRVQPAPPAAQPAQFTPRRIRPEDVGLVSRPQSPPFVSGGGFPLAPSISSISSTSTTEPPSIPTIPPPSIPTIPPPSRGLEREPSDVSAIEQQIPPPIPIAPSSRTSYQVETPQERRAKEIERLAGFPSGEIPTVKPRDIIFSEPALDTPPKTGLTGVAELFETPKQPIDPTIEGGGFAEGAGAKNIQGITRANKAFKAFIKQTEDVGLITKAKGTRRKNVFRELLAANENKRGRDKKLPKQILREEIDRLNKELNKELKLDFPSVKTQELVEFGAEGAKEAQKEKTKKKKPRK